MCLKLTGIGPNPSGLCMCGCGQPTRLARVGDRSTGNVAGCPIRFVRGHNARTSPLEYVEEDRGYKTLCWIWQRSKDEGGYGRMLNPRTKKVAPAHVVLYEREHGPIPDGLEPDHLCSQRDCVRPSHIEPVTHPVNCQRGRKCTISNETVARIKELSATMGCHRISRLTGVDKAHVRRILLGKSRV